MTKVKVVQAVLDEEKTVQSDDSGAAPSEISDHTVPENFTQKTEQVSDYETLTETEDSSHIGIETGNSKIPDLEKDEFAETLVSPTEEALEDLLSIIPQLHKGTGELRYVFLPKFSII